MSDVSQNESKFETEGRYLCFSLGKEKFAIPLLQVKEVIGSIETTAIPQAPAYFKGIMNLRGQVISVIDLRLKLKIGKAESNPETTIIILDFGNMLLGVIVDSVDSVTAYESKDISDTPAMDSSIKAGFIKGVARNEKSLTLILDLVAALSAEDLKTVKSQTIKAA